LCGVTLGKGEDSFETIPEILAGSTTGYQAWDAEVPQVPPTTCLVLVLEECERSVAGEEIHQVVRDGGHSVKDASTWGSSCRDGRCLRSVSLWGEKSGGRRGGCSSIGYHRAMGTGSVGHWGGDRGGRLVKALVIVPAFCCSIHRSTTESVLSSQMYLLFLQEQIKGIIIMEKG